MRSPDREAYCRAYDMLCRTGKCKSFEIYGSCVIGVFKHDKCSSKIISSNGYFADEWDFLHLQSYKTSFVECNGINTEYRWNIIKNEDNNVFIMKKFIVDVILDNAKNGDVTLREPGLPMKSTMTLVKRGMTLESLLVESDLELCAK